MAMRQAVTVGGDCKLGRLDEILDEYEESGAKVLVFSYFLDVLRRVGERFANHGSITGSMSPDDRFALVQDFQAAEGHRLLLLQIQAGGQGLNLQAASGVVIMEPQLKPTTEAQAVARAHRMGQTRRVVVHRLLARDSVDERLVEILKGKRELFEQFARQSLIKEASKAATESALAKAIVEAEQARLSS
jgi:SNF2 family DNA or RNA helicase